MTPMKLNLLFLVAITAEIIVYLAGLQPSKVVYGMKPAPNIELAYTANDSVKFFIDATYSDLHLKNVPLATPRSDVTVLQNNPPAQQTPAPSDTPAPNKPQADLVSAKRSVSAPGDIQNLIQKYANLYRVDSNLMTKIAKCESGFNPDAVNGPFAGLFQFISGTWITNRKAMGLNTDPALRFNAEEAIKTAAFKISRDGAGAWPVCSRA